MSRGAKTSALCPRCRRTITTHSGRYVNHNDAGGAQQCAVSGLHAPFTADQQTPNDYAGRASQVCALAASLRDEDTSVVWDYLGGLPADELQRLTMIALAGLDVDGKRVADVFGWVVDLPAATYTEMSRVA